LVVIAFSFGGAGRAFRPANKDSHAHQRHQKAINRAPIDAVWYYKFSDLRTGHPQ
jgi:hypothetical protein